MSESKITANAVTAAYVKLRDQRSENKRAFEAEDAILKEKMRKLEVWLLTKLNEVGADSFKTDSGTAYITTRDRASCADWGILYPWISEHGRPDMLEKRVATGTVTEYLEEHGELPPGISINREKTIAVRR